MTSVVSYGVLVFCMAVYRRQPAASACSLTALKCFRILLLQIVTEHLVFLWSLLLVVPGIIAVYRYRFAPFLLIDNPHMSVLDCIKESRSSPRVQGQALCFGPQLHTLASAHGPALPLNIYVLPYYTTTLAGFYDMRLAHDRQQNQSFAYTDQVSELRQVRRLACPSL